MGRSPVLLVSLVSLVLLLLLPIVKGQDYQDYEAYQGDPHYHSPVERSGAGAASGRFRYSFEEPSPEEGVRESRDAPVPVIIKGASTT